MKFVAGLLAVTVMSSAVFAQTPSERPMAERIQDLMNLQNDVTNLQTQVDSAKAAIATDKKMAIVGSGVAVVSFLITAKLASVINAGGMEDLILLVPAMATTGGVIAGVGTASVGLVSLKIDLKNLDKLDARLKVLQSKLDAKRVELGLR